MIRTPFRFDINLSYGPDILYQKPTGDNVALHVSYSGGARHIILNSFENGHWGPEEQYNASSIQQGAPFEIRILIDQGRFGVRIKHLVRGFLGSEGTYRSGLDLLEQSATGVLQLSAALEPSAVHLRCW